MGVHKEFSPKLDTSQFQLFLQFTSTSRNIALGVRDPTAIWGSENFRAHLGVASSTVFVSFSPSIVRMVVWRTGVTFICLV
jgi:hypothetical protein